MLVLLLSSLGIKAQDKMSFGYDAAGNRVSRVVVLDSSKARSVSSSQSVFFPIWWGILQCRFCLILPQGMYRLR